MKAKPLADLLTLKDIQDYIVVWYKEGFSHAASADLIEEETRNMESPPHITKAEVHQNVILLKLDGSIDKSRMEDVVKWSNEKYKHES